MKRHEGRISKPNIQLYLSNTKLSDDDQTYDLTRIINDALSRALNKDDVIRIQRFVETMTNKTLGEIFYEDINKAIELFEMAFGASAQRILSDLVKELMQDNECGLNPDSDSLSKYRSEQEILKHIIDSLIVCLKDRSKKSRDMVKNILKEIENLNLRHKK